MPTYPNYLSPWNSSGDWSMSYQSGGGYAPNMNDPQYDPNYYTGPRRGSMDDPQYQRQLQESEIAKQRNMALASMGPAATTLDSSAAANLWNTMGARGMLPGTGGGGGLSSGGGGGSSAAAQAALDRRFQMDLERMKLAQMDAQNKWNARMQGFGSDLSLRNNLYGIAAQQPSSQQVGNALQIIGGDSARAFQPPVNPIGPAKGAMDYWSGGTPPAQPPPYIRRG